jgi:hypothetical protein
MIITNLLTNMIVLTVSGGIPTNTPAFRDYAFQVMFTNAQSLAARWHLDQNQTTSNNVTVFSATPEPAGMTASIVFGNRYVFGASAGGPIGFTDSFYHKDQVSLHPTASLIEATTKVHTVETEIAKWKAVKADIETQRVLAERWAQLPNSLTLRKARRIAESAMRDFGVPMQNMRFRSPKVGRQLKWELTDSFDVTRGGNISYKLDHPISFLLPYYVFEWESERGSCRVHVSGITTNIVRFDFGWNRHPDWRRYGFEGPEQLRLKPPSNYLELLGLSTNTIFVKQVSPGKFMRLEE